MSIQADSVEDCKKPAAKGKKHKPECDFFPSDGKTHTPNKPSPTSANIYDQIIYNKQALLRTEKDGMSNIHRIATFISDPTLIETVVKTLTSENNFRQDASRQNYLGHSPLFVAIFTRNKTFAVMFLNAGAPLNQRDFLGKTIFHYLAQKDFEFFASEIFRESTFHPEEIIQALHIPDNEGVTPTHTAYQADNMIAFDKYYRHCGVPLLRRNDQKRDYTLLHMSAEKGDRRMAEFLLTNKEFKMSVDVMGADEATPLHLAVSHGHVELARYFLDSGADATIPLRENSVLGLVPYECQAEMRAMFAQRVPDLYNFLLVCSDNYYGDSSEDETS